MKRTLVGVGAGLVLMLAACGNTAEDNGNSDENEDKVEQIGETVFSVEGEDYTNSELLNDLVESQALDDDAVLDLVLRNLVETKFEPSEEQINVELDAFKEELDAAEIEGEEREEALEGAEDSIKEYLSLRLAIESVYEVTDEEVQDQYDLVKEKYTVLDIISYGEVTDETKTQIDELVKGIEGMTAEEANEYVLDQDLGEETQAMVIEYAKSELPLGDESVENLNEKGDEVEVENEDVYNKLVLIDRDELTFEELEQDVRDFALFNKVESHYHLLDLLQENNEDVEFDDYINKIIEDGKEGNNEETGIQDPESGIEMQEEVPEVVEEGIEEYENGEE